jgi:ligand-binding sensor domain-containing protein/signal transduction histidine kinase
LVAGAVKNQLKYGSFALVTQLSKEPIAMLPRLSNHAAWIKALLPFLFACLATIAHAQRLPLRFYTTADGLANNHINKIVRDSRGFLWFCTAEGLSLFDGYRFTNFTTDDGLPHGWINDLLETTRGEIWVATNAGLVRFDPKGSKVPATQVPVTNAPAPMFTVFAPEGDDRYSKSITKLLEGRDGTIWCGTRRGLFRLAMKGARTVMEVVEIGLPTEYPASGWIYSMVEDRHGTLWVGAATGLYRRQSDGNTAHYDRRDGLPDTDIHDLLEDREGNLWVGTRHGGLCQFAVGPNERPVITRIYNRKNGLNTDWVFDLHESRDGKLWVGTNVGLHELQGGNDTQKASFRVYTKRNGFSFHEILNVIEDGEGNLWLGTVAGSMKFARNGFLTFTEEDGIYQVNSLFTSGTGELYAVGYVVGDQKSSAFEGAKLDILNPSTVRFWFSLGHFNGERFTWLLPDALRKVTVSWSDKSFVTQSNTGEWWVGHYLFPPVSAFARLKTAQPFKVFPSMEGTSPVVYSLYEDSRGDVWISIAASIGNALSLWERTSRSVRDMKGTEGLPSLKETLPISFQEDTSGNVWVGLSDGGGLARYDGVRFNVFTVGHGLPPGRINDLYLDHASRLWIATSRGGLSRVDDPTATVPAFINYSTDHGLSSNFTNAITEDLHGRIYVSTGRGVDRISPTTQQIKHFTTADGLAPGEILTAHRDRYGALWFGTLRGLSRFVPGPEELSVPPPILISRLRLAGEDYNVSALGESKIAIRDLSAGENQLQIDFVGLSFASGETLRYQYKLEGADADWRSPIDQRSVNYASLSPGKYKFFVRAVNSDGIFSSQPATVTFTILSPIWMRWWFIALVVTLLALATYALYRYRLARILEVTNMRTRIATDLHDDIGANLTKITLLSEVARQQSNVGGDERSENNSPLAAIARISRESVASMSDIVWAINPQRDSFRDLVRRMRPFAEEIFTLRGVALVFNVSGDVSNLKLGADVRRDLFLFFKEAVNNAARHSRCTRVEIHLSVESSWISLLVVDNGIGFDTSLESSGQGLAGLRRRAEALGGSIEIKSRVGEGTSIRLRIPATARRGQPVRKRN